MEKWITALFQLLYIWLGWQVLRMGLRKLTTWLREARAESQIVTGTLMELELQWVKKPRRNGKVPVFYPVFAYRWQGKTYRNYGKRLPAGFDRELRPVPRTALQVGADVQVRLIPQRPGEGKLLSDTGFWRSGAWASLVILPAGAAWMGAGIYWLVTGLLR